MSSYDFRSLSDYDFERLVRDLLQQDLHLKLESFTSGRDGGIDLRHSRDEDRSVIVQCKHYAVSGYSKLLAHLKSKELPKIANLAPRRYILATSVGLTPQNKDEIQAALAPFILSPQDIYGASELNGILTNNPDIERVHIKLYLTSYAALVSGLNSEILSRTAGYLGNIEKKARLYVSSDGFTEALEMLDKHSVCIIAGIPGIGKTTLAEMLLLYHIGLGFEPVEVSSDIGEADRLYSINHKQVFVYDDFLGQTSLVEKLGKNEDARLESFMARIESAPSKRLILTTREYILHQAQLQYEKLDRSTHLRSKKYVLDLATYSRLDRAKIVYNHLFFSGIPKAWKQEFLRDKNYKRIATHGNFSPRLIEAIIQRAQFDSSTPAEFVSHALETLDNPMELWLHPFERHLRAEAQDLLLFLAISPPRILLRAAEEIFAALNEELGASKRSLLFREVLRTLDDSFVDLSSTGANARISLHNPSIRDFLLRYLNDHPEKVSLMLDHAKYYNQIELLCGYAGIGQSSPWMSSNPSQIKQALIEHSEGLLLAIQRTFDSDELEIVPISIVPEPTPRSWEVSDRLGVAFALRNELGTEAIDNWLRAKFLDVSGNWSVGADGSKKVTLILEANNSGIFQEEEIQTSARRLLDAIVREAYSMDDLSPAQHLLEELPDVFAVDDADSVSVAAGAIIDNEVRWILREADSASFARSTLKELKSFASSFGYSIDDSDMSQIEERISELEAREEAESEQIDSRASERMERAEEAEIDRLFETLLDLEE